MNTVPRSNSNYKNVNRGRGHQSLGRGQSQGNMPLSSSDRQDMHSRNRDSYYGPSSGHAGTPSQQHSSYPYDSSNWRAHGNNSSRNYPRTSQTPPTPESPSPSQPSFIEDETVKFMAEAWHEVENELRYPKDDKVMKSATAPTDRAIDSTCEAADMIVACDIPGYRLTFKGMKGFNTPIVYTEKSQARNRSEFEPFDLEGWHAKRVNRF